MYADKQTGPRSKPQRSFTVEGTVFWLVVSAIIQLAAVAATSQHVIEGVIIGALNLTLAYLCWRERRTGFLLAIILSLVVAIGAFPLLLGGEETPLGTLIDAIVILSALLTVLFGYRAYREA